MARESYQTSFFADLLLFLRKSLEKCVFITTFAPFYAHIYSRAGVCVT